jgi:hypothetical protein
MLKLGGVGRRECRMAAAVNRLGTERRGLAALLGMGTACAAGLVAPAGLGPVERRTGEAVEV